MRLAPISDPNIRSVSPYFMIYVMMHIIFSLHSLLDSIFTFPAVVSLVTLHLPRWNQQQLPSKHTKWLYLKTDDEKESLLVPPLPPWDTKEAETCCPSFYQWKWQNEVSAVIHHGLALRNLYVVVVWHKYFWLCMRTLLDNFLCCSILLELPLS